MLKFNRLYSGIFIVAFLISGCNGSDGGSGDDSQGKESVPPITNSFVKKITTNYQSTIDFSNYLYDEDISSLKIMTDIKSGYCNFDVVQGTVFNVKSDRDGLCIFNYNVRNAHGLSVTQSASILSVSGVGVVQYPVLTNYSSIVGNELNIDVFSDLIAKDPTIDLSGKVINEIYTTGVGNAVIDPSLRNIVFSGTEFGVASILYTIQDSLTKEVVGYGRIDIAVSSEFNQQPKAEEAVFPTVIEPNTKYLVDLDSFSPSITNDDDGDDLQIIDLHAFEGKFTIDPIDAGNLNNKRFYVEFPNSSANVQDVSYTVSDHNGGYATNIIRFRFNTPSATLYWRDIYYKNYKRFLAPLTKDLMTLVFPMITGSNVEDDIAPGEHFDVSIADYSTAGSYCLSRGARLPRANEFSNLYNLSGNLYNSDLWPHKKNYWLDNGDSINIDTGDISTPSSSDELYISCVKGGLEYSSIVQDNSFADGKSHNRIDFMLKDVYGIPLAGEEVGFDSSFSDVSFVRDSSVTKADGFAVSEFSSTTDGNVEVDAFYIDDILSANSNFNLPPKYSISILPESDSCDFGKCSSMQFGLADTILNAAFVVVNVTDDNTGLPVQNVEVTIEPKNSSESGKILFHNASGGIISSWLPKTSCFTQLNGNCLLNIALSDSSILNAYFKVSVSGEGEHTNREDYIAFNSILRGNQGTFDFQSGNNRKFADPENMTDCKGYGVKDTPGTNSLVYEPFSNSFSPELEVPSIAEIGSVVSSFECMNKKSTISPVTGRKTCTGLYTSHFNRKSVCMASGTTYWYEDAPEANSTYALTGSGSYSDGDNRFLVLKGYYTDPQPSKPGGFNYKLDLTPLHTTPGKPLVAQVEYDLYWPGDKYTSGDYATRPGSTSYLNVGLYKNIDSMQLFSLNSDKKEINHSNFTAKKWTHVKQNFSFYPDGSSTVYFRLWVTGNGTDSFVWSTTMFLDNLQVKFIY